MKNSAWRWRNTLRVYHLTGENDGESICWVKSLRWIKLTSNKKRVTCKNCKKIILEMENINVDEDQTVT